jgi:hypothetical protein
MLRVFLYLLKNSSHLSLHFLSLSLYRRYKRTYSRLFTLDTLDKRFLCLFFCNSIIGLYSLSVINNPSLRLGEIFILLPVIVLYLYFATKKLIGTVFYHYIWLIGMVAILMLNLSTFILDVLYYEGLLLQHENNQELSFIGKYLIDSISLLFKVLENGNFSLCSPAELPVELQKSNTKTFTDPIHPSYSKVKTSAWNAITRGIATGVFAQTMKNNPRLTYAVVGSTAVFSFVSDLVEG